jgi:hypothetical protein
MITRFIAEDVKRATYNFFMVNSVIRGTMVKKHTKHTLRAANPMAADRPAGAGRPKSV